VPSNHSKLTRQNIGRLLVRAYPEVLSGSDGENIYWHDGAKMAIAKTSCRTQSNVDLANPDLLEQFASIYPMGSQYFFGQPQTNDPGRIRNMLFFKKMYGSSREEVENNLVEIRWLPKSINKRLRFTRVNGANRQLEKVSKELDQLPRALRKFCTRIGGTYNWRNIAQTDQLSPHALGIAIDLNAASGDYWQWDIKNHGHPSFRNRIPKEIVEIFERHGFIWGGKWEHYDTMHFEYRPELILASNPDYGKVKVMFLSRQANLYGAERQLRYLVEALPRDRFVPVIVHAEKETEEDSTAGFKGLDPIQIRMRPWSKFSNVFARYVDAMSLLRLSQSKNIQLIHCSYQWLLPYAFFVACRMHIPLVAHIRRPNNGFGKLRSLGVHKCNAVIAISKRIRQELLQFKELKSKVYLITDAVELSSLKALPHKGLRSELNLDGQVVFGLVARIYKSKRQIDFVKAAKLLLEKGYDVRFVLVGRTDDEGYYRQLRSFIASNNLSNKIHLIGHRDDMTNILSSIDVLVSLSGGSVMYEAMAAGRTVISAGFTKPEESLHLINGLSGLVTESRDLNVLASLMERTVTEPELRKELGQHAQDYAQSAFRPTMLAKATEKIYDNLLSE
jgi:glycosyltransferase involved in cell wall biosynthesis